MKLNLEIIDGIRLKRMRLNVIPIDVEKVVTPKDELQLSCRKKKKKKLKLSYRHSMLNGRN